MKTRSRLYLYLSFLWKSALISSLIMFTSMAAGELLVDHNLFSGFLKKPGIWFGIFLETSIATLILSAIALPILYLLRFAAKKNYIAASVVTWSALSMVLMGLYAFFYWPREWRLTVMTPGLIFGWAIPGCLTLAILVWLSMTLRQSTDLAAQIS